MHAQLEMWNAAFVASRTLPKALPGVRSIIHRAPILALRPARVDHELDDLVEQYVHAAFAPQTQKAYANDWRLFESWCRGRGELPLPASSTTLARYLTHLAKDGRKASTIRRARIAIGLAHGRIGLERPDHDERIRALERGIGRTHGTAEQGARPLLVDDLDRMVRVLGASIRDARDRALLLLGFAGALRSSELAALDVDDILMHDSGMRIRLVRSKEDVAGRGNHVDIPRAAQARLCAVTAVARWLQLLDHAHGPLFRLCRGTSIEQLRIAARVVSRVVQRTAARAGLEPDYSSHSLRSGLATSAYAHGVSDRAIQVHGRWKSRVSLDRYIHATLVLNRPSVVDGLL
jgi:site-specific recombinase XerD